MTRQKAAEAGAAETVNIQAAGQVARVMCKCVQDNPPLETKRGEPGHLAACWFTE